MDGQLYLSACIGLFTCTQMVLAGMLGLYLHRRGY